MAVQVYNHTLWQRYRSPTWRFLPEPVQWWAACLKSGSRQLLHMHAR